ncbi:ZYRO0F09394p [Zygosaccharomyces rouxii]|uniref:ZYRO0F09394p n=1 Tax=Zygosaccharomyces rouxii (strain ATCC 2623 / CBS 732 / NBRC 1130 / NCYC 568 / NRRL Y-229) TaxID=559307 RepID=C5DY12_ZYGRC|nr:uncharacterized protein ZYRO0F09394g [Zygosaccharomyces rouxii]KAH9199432.1 N2227-like protein-domain-containing protein [Zygosaccharomyces rouxii]CAR28673.1 ZYRO0F09394p [Zygosaccharomyces rouxii]
MGVSTSSLPAIAFTILAVIMSFLRKYKPFQSWFIAKLENSFVDHFTSAKQLVVNGDFSLTRTSKNFKTAGDTTLYDLSKALSHLSEYLVRAQGQNGVIFQRTKELPPDVRDQLKTLSYFSKIQNVNISLQNNYKVVESVIRYVLEQLIKNNANNLEKGLRDQLKATCLEFGYVLSEKNELCKNSDNTIVAMLESNQYRVSEAISHLCRDWSPNFRCEREPFNQFFKERILSLGLPEDEKVLILVPGAGVGQLSHFLATNFPHYAVDSIEWSALMYICGQFALGYGKDVELSPFALRYSGQLDCARQIRTVEVQLSEVRRSSNLRFHWGDFCEFIPTEDHYDSIVVCTEFFIDTAENLFEYFETIERFKNRCNNLHWINAGPLKYGTRPLVQLNAMELNKLRQLRGWKDIHESNVTDYNHPLIGYLTDYGSLFQCYYGALKFHSTFATDRK